MKVVRTGPTTEQGRCSEERHARHYASAPHQVSIKTTYPLVVLQSETNATATASKPSSLSVIIRQLPTSSNYVSNSSRTQLSCKMHPSQILLTATLAFGAIAAPVANPALVSDLAPNVAALLTSTGLGGVAAPIGGTLESVSDNLKIRRALVADLSGNIADLLTAVGLGGVAPPVAATGQSVSDNVKRQIVADLSGNVADLLAAVGLGGVAPPVADAGQSVSDNVKRQIVADLSGNVADLLTAIGLGGVAPPVAGAGQSVSDNV